jgi:PrtD family type I secretion system ABC transporter
MRWLLIARLRPFVLVAAAASLLLNLALLVPSLYMLQVFERVFASRSVETLVMLSLFAAGALALAYCMDTARSAALARAGRALEARLAVPALEQALQLAAAGHGRAETDRLRDIAQLRGFLAGPGVQALFDAPWLPIYLLVITVLHPLLGATAAFGALALLLLSVLTERLTREPADGIQKRSRALGHHAEALTRHAEVIVGMGMGGAAVRRWGSDQQALLAAQSELGATSLRFGALARIARQALQLLALGIGAWLVVGANASPGIMVAATVLLGRALQPVELLIGGWKQLIDARAAWLRLAEPRELPGPAHHLSLPAPRGRLDIQRLVFAPDRQRPLLRDISLSLEPGESLGLIGPSGSGKTTLLRLILGLRVPQHGTVRLDGADIRHWNRDELGAHIGYLPQDVSLFSATVAQNIARLDTVDDEQVVAAAQLAQAHEMILRLPQGYDTPVGEAGAVLSGGQRQRVGLARALLGRPRLVVLDEPNAHLDAEGEAALKAALQALKAQGTTVIVVGHRPALMAQLDKLAVLQDGTLAAFGPATAVLARLQGAQAQPVHRINPHTHTAAAA